MYLTDSDTIKICWYWPDTDTDTRIGAALIMDDHLQELLIWQNILYINVYVGITILIVSS